MWGFMKKKKQARKMAQITLGLDLKRCTECLGTTRPCEVGGVAARFHRWVEVENALLRVNYMRPEEQREFVRRFREEGVCGPGGSLEKQRGCHALIEWPDGSVSLVDVHLIKFLDCVEG